MELGDRRVVMVGEPGPWSGLGMGNPAPDFVAMVRDHPKIASGTLAFIVGRQLRDGRMAVSEGRNCHVGSFVEI